MTFYITEKCNGCTACANICPTGAVSGIKKDRHTINPDYCIECGACGRVCPSGAVEDAFGQIVLRVKKKMWQTPVFDKNICTSCVICVDACPIGCITMGRPEGKNPNAFPELINAKVCLSCGFCMNECPVDAISMAIQD